MHLLSVRTGNLIRAWRCERKPWLGQTRACE